MTKRNVMEMGLDNPLLATKHLVLQTADHDCDGVSHAWHRVEVPAWLAVAVQNTQNTYLRDQGEAKEANALMLKEAIAGNLDRAEAAKLVFDRKERRQWRSWAEHQGTRQALNEFLMASEQWSSYAMSDGYHLLTDAERIEFEVGLKERSLMEAEEGTVSRGDWEWWQKESYHSEFYSR